jgi:hypothetical protein
MMHSDSPDSARSKALLELCVYLIPEVESFIPPELDGGISSLIREWCAGGEFPKLPVPMDILNGRSHPMTRRNGVNLKKHQEFCRSVAMSAIYRLKQGVDYDVTHNNRHMLSFASAVKIMCDLECDNSNRSSEYITPPEERDDPPALEFADSLAHTMCSIFSKLHVASTWTEGIATDRSRARLWHAIWSTCPLDYSVDVDDVLRLTGLAERKRRWIGEAKSERHDYMTCITRVTTYDYFLLNRIGRPALKHWVLFGEAKRWISQNSRCRHCYGV